METQTLNQSIRLLLSLLESGSAQEIAAACGNEQFNNIIPGLRLLIGCEQNREIHLEGDVAIHTGLVVVNIRNAALRRLNRKADTVELVAALVHDLKKPETKGISSTGQIHFKGHEEKAGHACAAIAQNFGLSANDAARLTFAVSHHGKAHFLLSLDDAAKRALITSPYVTSLALLQEADALSCLYADGSAAPIHWEQLTAESLDGSYFEAPVDRRIYKSIKWNSYPQDVLPLWVADMDFRSPPAVIQALTQRAQHGEFGYEDTSSQLLSTITRWCKEQYGWHVTSEEIVPLPGLVCGLNAVCRATGAPGESAVVFTPVYPPFLSSPTNNGMETIEVPLTQVARSASEFHYTIDLNAFEQSLKPNTKVCILCHPHNPSGEAWSTETIRALAALCKKRNIVLCSDEIHCDLILDGSTHVPTSMAAPEYRDNLITLMAPSKTFNVPGLGYSFAIIHNPEIRKRFKQKIDGPAPHPNAMGIAACEAAFSSSAGWLREVRRYIASNRDFAVTFIREKLPLLKATNAERTYLLWIDCRGIPAIADAPSNFFLKEARIALNDGVLFGKAGRGFVRLNLGAPQSRIAEALHSMKVAVDKAVDK